MRGPGGPIPGNTIDVLPVDMPGEHNGDLPLNPGIVRALVK